VGFLDVGVNPSSLAAFHGTIFGIVGSYMVFTIFLLDFQLFCAFGASNVVSY
jgi:hypothetical protein